MRSCRAELTVLGRRSATWVLATTFVVAAVFFLYAQPYLLSGGGSSEGLAEVLPAGLVGNTLVVFPFYGGILVLFLAAIAAGGEYGGGTLGTILTQCPARWKVFFGRLIALGVVLLFIVITVFGVGAACSYLIAQWEDAVVEWPAVWALVRAVGAGWFILAVWAALGTFLAVLLRGASLAIAVGIVYALVTEGLISEFANRSGVLDAVSKIFLRPNAYSLVAPFGTPVGSHDGPGAYTGSLVDPGSSALVLAAYGIGFIAVAAFVFQRRDVA